ncbi:WbqC family protein [Acidovorax sp. NCPPB 3576]|uniref:WbqC family protein n=1 Tax=Acidovorax sp. NCPPB 3576 TaxID=2940488 RepID=UPI00234A2F86|nr:WbqC family protein [Acidovorax sp. NCPPB 3576]WCM88433.1 WbqC family protein [Acidovorax sp. NCPPB 3576]
MKKVAILQSNYIPWKGYFDIIASVDELVIYDDMQYTRRDWRNRNKIKTPQGVQWLTVPVMVKGRYHQKIRDTQIDGADWAPMHWKALEQNYKRAPFFEEIAAWLQPLYAKAAHSSNISELNCSLIEACCDYLGIATSITKSWDYVLQDDKVERLVDLCKQCHGDIYVSGPAAKDYINESIFSASGVQVSWFDYSGYPQYPQLWGDFVHEVSVLDLFFNCGKGSRDYMKKSAP